ncbi:MAG: hypothetical protein JKY65_04755 [Planctomycetes bacterium]|nr:hypothetical protein [Planctomycetota bacterium]
MFARPLPLASSVALALCLGFLSFPFADAKTSKSDVAKAFKSADKERVIKILGELEGELDKKTIKAVVDHAKRLRSLGVYEELVTCLRTAKGEALDELVKNYKKQKKGGIRFLVVDGLGLNPEPKAEEILFLAAKKDKDEPIRALSIRLLGKRNTKSAVAGLISLLGEVESRSERLSREINGALGNLTGEDLAVAEDWKNWWASHQSDFTPKVDDDKGGTKARGNLLDRMAKDRPAELKTMTRMKNDEIVVIRGNDKVEDVLKALKLKYKRIEREAFDDLKLNPETQLLLLNCPGRAAFTDKGIQKIRDFVAQGGYIFCSDWELGKTLAKAFPEACQFLRESPKGPPKETTIAPFPGAVRHPLMRDVFPLNTFETGGFAWKLEGRSHLAKTTPHIVPLVSCAGIKDLGTTMVAFSFSFTSEKGGRPVTGAQAKKLKRPPGQVVWVSSHFKLQKDPKTDGFALQQLLLNFILEKQNQKRAFQGR